MKLINGSPWVNLESFLDMKSFDLLEDRINYTIAKNSRYIEPSYTPRMTFMNSDTRSFLEERAVNKEQYHELSADQLNWYTKLSGAATLGSHLVVRGVKGYPSTYQHKHLSSSSLNAPCYSDFDFLFKWIEEQNCFAEYGRTMFWINEPSQTSVFHTDYGNINSDKRDMFIWLTGTNSKKIILKDDVTGCTYVSSGRAMVFNTVNWHSSQGHPDFTSWSLRIDGSFSKEWAARAGIDGYYNI